MPRAARLEVRKSSDRIRSAVSGKSIEALEDYTNAVSVVEDVESISRRCWAISHYGVYRILHSKAKEVALPQKGKSRLLPPRTPFNLLNLEGTARDI